MRSFPACVGVYCSARCHVPSFHHDQIRVPPISMAFCFILFTVSRLGSLCKCQTVPWHTMAVYRLSMLLILESPTIGFILSSVPRRYQAKACCSCTCRERGFVERPRARRSPEALVLPENLISTSTVESGHGPPFVSHGRNGRGFKWRARRTPRWNPVVAKHVGFNHTREGGVPTNQRTTPRF